MIKYTVLTCIFFLNTLSAQQLEKKIFQVNGNVFEIYPFLLGNGIKVKYFSSNAFERYNNWAYGKNIFLMCSGAFSETWEKDSKPIGFTVDNGELINLDINKEMDALVGITNGSINVIDIDLWEQGYIDKDGSKLQIDLKNNDEERILFANIAMKSNATFFQTQLVYSQNKLYNFIDEDYGKKAERRFLAICSHSNFIFTLIINIPESEYLNRAGKYAKHIIELAGYNLQYLVNLDTGGKNIFVLNNGTNLVYAGDDQIKDATSLLIFYK